RRIHTPRLVRVDEQRLYLGGEPQLARYLGPEQRLFTGPVARQHEAAARVVPHGEPEHPLEPCHGVGPEPLIQRHDRLDVARRTERIPRTLAFLAQRRRVVDLAVADHPDRVVGTLERLVARGQVHDGEAAGAEAGAVPQGCTGERDGAEDAAHYRTLPPRRGGCGGCGGWGGWEGRHGP